MRALRALVPLALVAAAGCMSPPSTSEGCVPRGVLRDGDPLPACSFRGFDGETITLESLRGKPAVLNFWAEWCVACKKEMPAFERVWTSHRSRLTVIGFDALNVLGETEARARKLVREVGVTYPLAFDTDGRLYAHFGTSLRRPVMPVTVYVDRDGIVRRTRFGELAESDIRSDLRTLFGIR